MAGRLAVLCCRRPAEAQLKDYVGFVDCDMVEEEWFENHFPEELQLRHALAAYTLLEGQGQGSAATGSSAD